MDNLEYELDLEYEDNEFEEESNVESAPALPKCPYPFAPPPGHFGGMFRSGHRLFTPKYLTPPSNIWSLARMVRTKMIDFRKSEHGVPSVLQIIEAIRTHPSNAHLKNKMFLPRFGPDRCTPGRGHYGVIYLPFKF